MLGQSSCFEVQLIGSGLPNAVLCPGVCVPALSTNTAAQPLCRSLRLLASPHSPSRSIKRDLTSAGRLPYSTGRDGIAR